MTPDFTNNVTFGKSPESISPMPLNSSIFDNMAGILRPQNQTSGEDDAIGMELYYPDRTEPNGTNLLFYNTSSILAASADVHTTNVTTSNLPLWTPLAALSFTETLACLILNGLALAVFIRNPKLRVHFNIYLMNLALANFTYFAVEGPLDVFRWIYSTWWLGEQWCTVYMYGLWVLSLVQFLTHPLIALNRLWAIAMPVNYRQYHSTRTALLLSAGTWIVGHLVALPGVILDAAYYREPLDGPNGCAVNSSEPSIAAWQLGVQLMSVGAEAVVVGVFPLIWYLQKGRQKVGHGVLKTEYKPGGHVSTFHSHEHRESQLTGLDSTEKAKHPEHHTPIKKEPKTAAQKRQMHAFVLLTLLTTSVILCWTPSVVYFTATPFVNISRPELDTSLTLLYNFQSVMDPIIFTLSLTELRHGLRTLCVFL